MEFTFGFNALSFLLTTRFGSSGTKPSIHLANLFIKDLILSWILATVDLETEGLGIRTEVSIAGTGASIKLLFTVSFTPLVCTLEINRRRSMTLVSHYSE